MAETIAPIFRVDSAREAVDWYGRIGFEVIGEHQFEVGFPLYVLLRRGEVFLHLSEHLGDAPTGSVAYLYVDDLDDIASEFGVRVTTENWGREVELEDPWGNRLRIGVVS